MEANNSIWYYLTAPEIDSTYVDVDYVFHVMFHSDNSTKTYIYTVTVVSDDLINQFSEMQRQLRLYVPLLIVTTGICILIGSRLLIEELFRIIRFLRRRK